MDAAVLGNRLLAAGSYPNQGAAKGVRQKEFDHFFFVFGTLSATFGHFFWCFCHFLPNSFCGTPFASGSRWRLSKSLSSAQVAVPASRESSKVLAGFAFYEMLSQYAQSDLQGFSESRPGGGGSSEKHRACEPQHLTHELAHESAHENAHENVHEDVHENAHESWGFPKGPCRTKILWRSNLLSP